MICAALLLLLAWQARAQTTCDGIVDDGTTRFLALGDWGARVDSSGINDDEQKVDAATELSVAAALGAYAAATKPCFILATTVSGARREQRAETGEERRLEARICSTLLRRGHYVVPPGAPPGCPLPLSPPQSPPSLRHCVIASLHPSTEAPQNPPSTGAPYRGAPVRKTAQKRFSSSALFTSQ